ncbi:alpha/beta-Hydrolases superfamily protein [Carex rostrata]
MGDLGVCKEESINGAGGTDMWSSSDGCTVSPADHLVVMVHGILGSNTNWKFAEEHFVKMLPDKVLVHCSERNINRLTLDGVDVMGERLAEEVTEVIKGKPNLRKISFVAHSIGGLVARYAIGRLFRPSRRKSLGDSEGQIPDFENSSGTICGLEAMNFITIATPHLGSRGNRQVPFLFGLTAVEKLACHVIHLIFRRTGRHLFLVDSDDGKPPLLQRMIEDCDDLYFMSALRAFKRRVAYSNVAYDHIVGWRTSSIRRNSELPKFQEIPSEIYPHIVHEETSNGENPDKCNEAIITDGDYDMIEENLVRGLRRVSWEKVDVSFHTSKQKFAAHSIIQVKDPVMHSEGADVIHHVIDRFLT